MVKIATAISFLAAPFIAILNYLVIYKTDLKEEDKPNKAMRIFSLLGIGLLVSFSIYYVIVLFQ